MTGSSEEMLPGLAPKRRRKGRHEYAADRSIRDARDAGALSSGHSDDMLVSGIRAIARQLDVAEADDKPYATAALTRELREMLAAARMDPAARTPAAADPFASLAMALNDDSTPDA